MSKRVKNIIHSLHVKAKNKSWESAYQLYEYYRDGKYIEKDYNAASSYMELAIQHINSDFLSIEEIAFSDFRGFSDIVLKFPKENLLLIAGENGVGKSSILDGISYSLSWLVNRILYKGGKGKEFDRLDIKYDSEKGYSSILMKLAINKNARALFELCEVHLGGTANKKSYLTEFSKLGALYKFAGEKYSNFTMPLFAYYGISRTIDISTKDINMIDEYDISKNDSRFEAYINSFSGKADIKSFLKWFKRLDDIEKHRMTSSEVVSEDEDLINKLSILAPSDINARNLLETLLEKKVKNDNENSLFEIKKIKETLNHAIFVCMDGYSNLEIEIEPVVKLTITKKNHKLNILQLSQGEKSLLSLVLDIARRMLILNPNENYPLHSPGIVVIDEIDLHLHPQWQRSIVESLYEVFRNCQFIVSTHSPQVISEVKHKQIFILTENANGMINTYNPKQSYGLTSNEILNELMSADKKQLIRSYSVECKLDEIFDLIEQGNISLAKDEISNLESQVNGDIPELLSAKMEIELQEWDENDKD